MKPRLAKKKSGEEPTVDNDNDNDNFDIAPLDVKTKKTVRMPVGGILTPDKIEAVRFQEDKPGYAFAQVDVFIEQVNETLVYYEDKSHEAKLQIHELEESLADSLERQGILQQTIGVFKVKGDPLVSQDGSYLTESQTAGSNELNQKIKLLTEEKITLQSKLTLSEKDAQEAWLAYDGIRDHIEKTLEPFIREKLELLAVAEQKLTGLQDQAIQADEGSALEAIVDNTDKIEPELVSDLEDTQLEVAQDLEDTQDLKDTQDLEEHTFEGFTQTETLHNLSGKNWDGAPSAKVALDDEKKSEVEIPVLPVAPTISAETAQRRKAILLQSPEVAELESSEEAIEIEDLDFVEEDHKGQSRPDLLALAPELSPDEDSVEIDQEK